MADDKLREQVSRAVCSIAIGSERVETVMEIIQEHTAKAESEAQAWRDRADYWKKRAENAWEREDERAHHMLARTTAMQRARALADVSGWHVYESQDTGDVYPAALVQDLMADIRATLDGSEAPP